MILSTPPDGQPERRKDASLAMIELLTSVKASVDDLNKKFDAHVVTQREEMKELVAAAFPGEDPDGHRRHHEAVIKEAEDRAKFWQEMRIAAAKWAGLGVITFAVAALWHELLMKIPK